MKILTLLSFIFILQVSLFAQSQTEKINSIIDTFQLVNIRMELLNFSIEELKNKVRDDERLQLIALEKKYDVSYMRKKIQKSFEESLNSQDIDDLYHFTQSSVFQKLFKENPTQNLFLTDSDLDADLAKLREAVDSYEITPFKKNAFSPIPTDRENGIYEMKYYKDNDNFELKTNPSIHFSEIEYLSVGYDDREQVKTLRLDLQAPSIPKFQDITTKNLLKPLAIVADHHIIAMPVVASPIPDGRLVLSNNITEEVIDSISTEM